MWAGRISGGVLTSISGYVSAATWTRYGTVGGPMTGNTIRFGVYMADGQWVRGPKPRTLKRRADARQEAGTPTVAFSILFL